jgi:tripartite-type tricarboxylate transporter receptor subunit TctC
MPHEESNPACGRTPRSPSEPARSTSAVTRRADRAPRPRAVSVLAVGAVLVSACSGTESSGGASGGYPDRQITMVVPFSAGGPTDTVTRLIAEPMSAKLGQQIVVQNVEGAGGTLGAGQVARATPDGYTVLMHHIGMSTAPTLYPQLPYAPLEDFETVGLVTEVPMTIVGRKDLAPNTLQELVAYVRGNPGGVTLATAGVGAASQLCGLLIERAFQVDVTEVPYEGTGPALTDLVGGQVDMMCDQTTNTTGQITAGGVKAYAVTTPERVGVLPDLPTTTEAGLPDVQVSVWHGLYVPADTPPEVVQALTDALAVALQDQNVVAAMAKLGTAPVAATDVTPQAHSDQLRQQIDFWGPVIKAASPTPGG